jgi:hypothetical protein
VPNVVL